MFDLDTARMEIDFIDGLLIEILNKRMSLCKDIGAYKKENNLPIYNSDRENQVIEKLKSREKYEGMVEAIWHPIMDYAKTIE